MSKLLRTKEISDSGLECRNRNIDAVSACLAVILFCCSSISSHSLSDSSIRFVWTLTAVRMTRWVTVGRRDGGGAWGVTSREEGGSELPD